MPLHKGTAFGNLWYKSKLMERRAPTQGHGIRESLVQIKTYGTPCPYTRARHSGIFGTNQSKFIRRRAPTQGHGIRESLVQINQNLSAAVPLHKGTAFGNLWYKSIKIYPPPCPYTRARHWGIFGINQNLSPPCPYTRARHSGIFGTNQSKFIRRRAPTQGHGIGESLV